MSGHHPPPSCHWQDVLHTVHFDTKTLFLTNLFRGLVWPFDNVFSEPFGDVFIKLFGDVLIDELIGR